MSLFGLKKTKAKKIDLGGIYQGHYNVLYRGVECVKSPFDYVLYQMIIHEVKPDLIIEIGANSGGSAYYMADLLESIGHGKLHSIDIIDKVPEVVKNHPRIEFFFDGWQNYEKSQAQGDRILVIEDSSHQYENTLQAIKSFAPLVTVGSYLIVEDGIIDDLGFTSYFNGGPLKAINEFLPDHHEFLLDEKWHSFFGEGATFNTKGFLKRIM